MAGYVNPKINRTTSGGPQSISTEIVVIDLSKIANWPGRDNNKIKMVGGIPLIVGAYVQEVYGTATSISLAKGSEGDEDSVSFAGTPEFSHPGSPLEIEEFIALNTNKQLALAFRIGACDGEDEHYKVFGSPCAPLTLMVESTNNNEGAKDLMKFEQKRRSATLPGRYYGTFTKATANIVVADTTEVDVANGQGEYQLADNAAATVITTLLNAVIGRNYTLIGSGGANPATIEDDATSIITTADWQGLSGSRITLNAIAHGTTTKFIEVSRS